MMPNFNSIASGVSEPQVAGNRYLPLTKGIALTTVYVYVLHCDEIAIDTAPAQSEDIDAQYCLSEQLIAALITKPLKSVKIRQLSQDIGLE